MEASDLWVLIAAALVFLMQAGFLCFEVGLARRKHQSAVAIKNLIDWALVSTLFMVCGYGLMFGDSSFGLVGFSRFGGSVQSADNALTISEPVFMLFQLTFAGTAVTIVSGALVERISFVAYVILSVIMAVAIYPVVGHWVWGGTIQGETTGWLEKLGFHDFAGASAVHLTGAVVALVGVKAVGPRLGRFRADGSVTEFSPSNAPLSALGTLVLWIGWWGFNGGSAFAASADVPAIILRTNVAGAAGLLAAPVVAFRLGERQNLGPVMMIGGLSGLVSITAVADSGTLLTAAALGAAAGAASIPVQRFLLARRIDDALGVVPVHGTAAVTGLILGPVLTGAGSQPLGAQLVVQVVGVLAVIGWAGVLTGLALSVLGRTIGLRMSPTLERTGDETTTGHTPNDLAKPLSEADLADLL